MVSFISEQDFSDRVSNALHENNQSDEEITIDRDAFAIRRKNALGQVLQSIYLANFYMDFKSANDDDARKKVLEYIVAYWSNLSSEEFEYDEVKDLLRPVIRARCHYPEQGTTGTLSYPQMVISDHLTSLIAMDLPHSILAVNESDFQRWNISYDNLFDVARKNLATIEVNWEIIQNSDDERDCLYIYEGAYASSSIVFPAMIADLEVLGRTLVIAPAKDVLLVTGSDCLFGLEEAARLIADCESRQDALLPELLSMDDNNCYFSASLPENHPAYNTFHMIELTNNLNVYNEYKRRSSATFEHLQNSNRFTDFEIMEQKGKLFSEIAFPCNESKILLPITDQVSLLSPDDRLLCSVDAESFYNVVSDKVVVVSKYPVVYELVSPLSKSEIDTLTGLSR